MIGKLQKSHDIDLSNRKGIRNSFYVPYNMAEIYLKPDGLVSNDQFIKYPIPLLISEGTKIDAVTFSCET